jgi:hypothetical protein
MFKRIIGASAIAAAGIVLCSTVAAPAFASTATPSPSSTKAPRSLAEIQAAGSKATSTRIADLTKAITRVDADTHLTSSDKSALLATLNSDETAMKTLATKIAADTTTTQASADVTSIFTGYRVLAVALPQARIVAAADRLSGNTIGHLTTVEKKLAADLAGKDASKSTPALQADLTDMTTQISTIQTQTASLAAHALAVTPAQFNSDKTVLTPEKTAAKAALAAAKKAASDAKTVRAAIK